MPADDYCYLTTIGRRTGRDHEIEIWYARSDDTLYLLSGGGERSDWVKNLEAMPKCRVRLGRRGKTLNASARLLVGESDEATTARQIVFEKYTTRYSGELESWRDTALPVALDLADE